MHVRLRLPPPLPPPPPPLHPHRQLPAHRIPLWRTCRCSFISIIPSSTSAASSPSSKASISLKHPSTPELHTPLQVFSLQHPCDAQEDGSQAVTTRVSSPRCIPLFPSARRGSFPSPVLFTSILSPKRRSGKIRQAVSSSCESVCWLGSWSSTVPLEDDPVDEDRRDGPGGAAGETEDSHPKHRWVAATQHHLSPPIIVLLMTQDYTCLSDTWIKVKY